MADPRTSSRSQLLGTLFSNARASPMAELSSFPTSIGYANAYPARLPSWPMVKCKLTCTSSNGW